MGGIIRTLTIGLKKYWKNSIVMALAGEILAQLALNMTARKKFSFSMTVPVLVWALSHEISDVRSGCSLALRNLSEFRDGVEVLLEHDAMMVLLVKALSDGEDEVALNLVTMFSYVTNSQFGLAKALKNQVVPPLLKLLQRVAIVSGLNRGKASRGKKSEKPILRECLKVIRNLSHDSGGNSACIKYGAVKEIGTSVAAVLKYRNWTEANRSTAAALNALAGSETGKKEICNHCISFLAHLAANKSVQRGFSGHPSTQANSASAIRSASEYPPARQAFVRKLLPNTELLVLVFGTNISSEARTRALRVLNDCLVDNDTRIRIHAVKAIYAMIKIDAKIIMETMACLNIVRNLALILIDMASGDEGLLAASVLELICSESDAAVEDLNGLQNNPAVEERGFSILKEFSAVARFIKVDIHHSLI